MIHFNEKDMARLEKACESYRDQTGSEYMWDQYADLIVKLNKLCDQGYCSTTHK